MSGDERRGDGDDDADSTTGTGGPAGDGSDVTDAPVDETGGEEAGNWRFTLEDLAEREAEETEDDGNGGEGIAGVFGPSEEIEPGTIDRESVVFVLLGAIVAGVGLYLMVAP